MLDLDIDQFSARALDVANTLKALANDKRLMILCKLIERGRATVTDLALAVGLSQSALSQHLARMRSEGLVAFDRVGQTLWYRVADPRVGTLIGTLYTLYCAPDLSPDQGTKA